MLHIERSIRHIKFFEDRVCVGFNVEKVRAGIEDLTEISQIDNSRNWNSGIYACQIHKYTEKKSKQFYRQLNADIFLFNEVV